MGVCEARQVAGAELASHGNGGELSSEGVLVLGQRRCRDTAPQVGSGMNMLNYDVVKNWDFGEITHTYSQRDSTRSAWCWRGSSRRGSCATSMRRTCRRCPRTATVLGSPGFWWRDPRTGADWVKPWSRPSGVFKPLPPGTVVARNRVVSLTDKGAGKGGDCGHSAELTIRRRVVCWRRWCMHFSRGDGGYSQGPAPERPGAAGVAAPPDTAPAFEVEFGSTWSGRRFSTV